MQIGFDNCISEDDAIAVGDSLFFGMKLRYAPFSKHFFLRNVVDVSTFSIANYPSLITDGYERSLETIFKERGTHYSFVAYRTVDELMEWLKKDE